MSMDAHLSLFTKRITNESDLCNVAIDGLGIDADNVKAHTNDNSKSINTAAYNVFKDWLSTCRDEESAREKIKNGLRKTGKLLWIKYFEQKFDGSKQ